MVFALHHWHLKIGDWGYFTAVLMAQLDGAVGIGSGMRMAMVVVVICLVLMRMWRMGVMLFALKVVTEYKMLVAGIREDDFLGLKKQTKGLGEKHTQIAA